jgi:hypothetical protein
MQSLIGYYALITIYFLIPGAWINAKLLIVSTITMMLAKAIEPCSDDSKAV